jgi:ABC-type branched-subunit amino acid transport system substrate-binding protein
MKNRTVKAKSVGMAILAIALAALLMVTACAPTPITPASGQKVVEIGSIPILTGGGGPADQPAFEGFMDYVRYFNEEESIPGVTLEVVWRDCGTQASMFMSAYRNFVDSGIPVIFSDYLPSLEGLTSQIEKDQIPFVTGAVSAPIVSPPGWIFAVWATASETATAVLDYFMENWKEESPPKLQLFISDDTYGRGVEAELTKYAQSIGFEVLPIEVCPMVVIDASTQLLRIREHEADLVYIQHINILGGTGPIMRDVVRLGLEGKIQFGGNEWVMGESLIEMSPAGAEGFLAPKALPWIDETEIPGIRTMRDMQLKYEGKVRAEPTVMGGWVYAATVCEAVRRAVGEVGYENINGPAIKAALESMKDFDVDGIVKISYGPEERRGTRNYAVYQVQGGKIVRISDYRQVPILVAEE